MGTQSEQKDKYCVLMSNTINHLLTENVFALQSILWDILLSLPKRAKLISSLEAESLNPNTFFHDISAVVRPWKAWLSDVNICRNIVVTKSAQSLVLTCISSQRRESYEQL